MNSFLNNIDFIARSPGGVALLRKLVLELAVRGKLVSQDPKDEPASVLLERINREKARLVKEGKIKAGKALPAIKVEEKPYELPKGWEWVRLGEIADQVNGKAFRPSDWVPTGLPIVRIQNLNDSTADYHYCKKDTIDEKYLIKKDQILISWSGTPGTSFGAFRWKGDEAALNQHINRVILFGLDHYHKNYFVLMVNSQLNVLISEARGAVGLRHVTMGQLDTLCVPLPPLLEQSRIVARVQELMAVLDRLEDQTNKMEQERNRALIAVTQAVSQAATPEEIAFSWLRLATDLGRLVDRAEDVKAIRAMVLELAVRGKLVPQDPKDEPASVLIERIKREKARLVKEGKIKAGKELPEITEEEGPFELPNGWKWERLGKIVKKLTDGTHHSPINKPTGAFLYISAKNIKWTGLDLSEITYVAEEVHKGIYSRCDPEFGDILYIKDGATTGISAINTIHEPFSMLSSVALIKPSCGVSKEYLHTVLQSPYFFKLMRQGMSGVAITRITLEKLGMAPYPLAPLREQSRIVARVQELMTVLDRLEGKLAARDKMAVLASESIVKMKQA